MRPHRSLVVWMFSIKPPKERLQSELACPATHDDARHEAQRALVVVWKSKLGELPHLDKQNKMCQLVKQVSCASYSRHVANRIGL